MDNSIEVILFEKSHAYDIKLQARDEYIRNNPYFDAWMSHNAAGAGFTGIRKSDGKIIACGGIRVNEPGVGEIWGLFSDEIGKYRKALMQDAMAYMKVLINKLDLHKIIAYVRCDQTVDIKFIERIGFERDGLLKMADWDKKDYYVYSTEIQRNPLLKPDIPFEDKINVIEKKMREAPDVQYGDCYPLVHSFAKGLYIRKITVPAGVMLVSKVHRYSYAFFVLKGEFETLTEDGVKRITAPDYMVMTAGKRHNALILQDTVVVTVHAAEETDLEKVEDELIYKPFDPDEYRELTKKVIAAEKDGFWSDWTKEQQEVYTSGDWMKFSRLRGYSEEEIADCKKWIEMKDIGEMYGHKPFDIVKDLTTEAALKNIAKDTKGEILKSSHWPVNGQG